MKRVCNKLNEDFIFEIQLNHYNIIFIYKYIYNAHININNMFIYTKLRYLLINLVFLSFRIRNANE